MESHLPSHHFPFRFGLFCQNFHLKHKGKGKISNSICILYIIEYILYIFIINAHM